MPTIICPNTKSKEFLDLVAKVSRVKPMSAETATDLAKILFVKNEGDITDEIIRHEVENGGVQRYGLSPAKAATKDERKTTMTLLKEISVQSGLGKISNVIFTAVKSDVPSFRVDAVLERKGEQVYKNAIVVNTNTFTSASAVLEVGHTLLDSYSLKNKEAYYNARKELQKDSDFKLIYDYKLRDEVKTPKPEGLKGKFDPYSKEAKDRAFNRAVIDLLKHEGSRVLTGEKTSNKSLLELKSGIDKELQGALKKLGVEGAENITSDITIGRLTNELKNKNGEASFATQAAGWKSLEKRIRKENPDNATKTAFTDNGVAIFFESREDAISASFSFPNNVINLVEHRLDENNTSWVLQVHKPLGEMSEPTHEILGFGSYPERNAETGKYNIVDSDKNAESDKEFVDVSNAIRSITGYAIPSAGGTAWKVSSTVSRLFGKRYYNPDAIDNALKSSFTDESNYNKFHTQMKDFYSKYKQSGWSIDKGGVNVVDRENGILGRSSLIVTEKGSDGLPVKKLIKFEIYKDTDVRNGEPVGYKLSQGNFKSPFAEVGKSQENYHELELGLQAHLLTNAGEVIHEIEVVPISIDMTSEGDINNAEILNPIKVIHDSRTQENTLKLLEHRAKIDEGASKQKAFILKTDKTQAPEYVKNVNAAYSKIMHTLGVEDISKVTLRDLNAHMRQHGNNVEEVLSGLKMNDEAISKLSVSDILHHYGNNTAEKYNDFLESKQRELSEGGSHNVKKVDSEGMPVFDSKGKVVDETVSGSEYSKQFAKDSIKADKLLSEFEKELSADPKYKDLSNIEKVNQLFSDKDMLIKLNEKLYKLNPDAAKYLSNPISKALFTQEVFKTFVKEHSAGYDKGRIATLMLGELMNSETGSFTINDFNKQWGGLIEYTLLPQYIDSDKSLLQFMYQKKSESQRRIDDNNKRTEQALDAFAKNKVFDNLEVWSTKDVKGNLVFKNPEDIDGKKYPNELAFVNFYNELKSKYVTEGEDLRIVPTNKNENTLKELAGGVLVSKPYDHINIPVETVDASGEKVVEVRRLGDLKKEVLDLTSWKDIEKDANDKIKNDFKKYDNLAKKVYDNGKGSKDYAGKDVAFDQRGRRVSNLRSYKDDVRNKNIKPAIEFHLKELAVKKEMETLLPIANVIRNLYTGGNKENPQAKHVVSMMTRMIRHDLLGQNVDVSIPYVTKFFKGMINMSYAANLLFRPKLWLKHGMARTLNLAINHPKEAFASMYALRKASDWSLENIGKDISILHSFNKGMGRIADVDPNSTKAVFRKLESVGHVGYYAVDTFLHGTLMRGIVEGMRPGGMEEVRKGYDEKGNKILNPDGTVKFPDLVLSDEEIKIISNTIDSTFGAYGEEKMQYTYYTIGKVLGQYTGAWAIPQLMNMWGKPMIDVNGKPRVGYLLDTSKVIYDTSKQLASIFTEKKGVEYRMTPEKWNNLMRTAIAGVLTSGYALGFQYFKKDIDKYKGVKPETLSPEDINDKHSAEVWMGFMTLGLSELLGLIPYAQGLFDDRSKGKVGGAYSVLAGERASSAMSNVAFFAHIAADAYKFTRGSDIVETPTATTALKSHKLFNDAINELGIVKDVHKWYRGGFYVPGLGHQGENQVYSEKRIMHIAKGANLFAIQDTIDSFVKNNNIDVYSESGHEEFVKWVKDNKELINALGEQAEKNAITNMMGVAGMKSEEYLKLEREEINRKGRLKSMEASLNEIEGLTPVSKRALKEYIGEQPVPLNEKSEDDSR